MKLEVVGLVLLAAICHATWNAFVKASSDRVAGLVAINLVSAVFGALFVPWVAFPDEKGWWLLSASVVVHLLYKLLLPLVYQTIELNRAYPVIRGVPPLLVGGVAALVLGEHLSLSEVIGMAAICLGVLILSIEHGRRTEVVLKSLALPILTGTTIAIYTVIDGIGVRHATSPFAFAAWLFLLDGAVFIGAMRFWQGPALWSRLRGYWWGGLASGLVALGSYAVFLWALNLGAMGTIAALRETSVLFAVLIGVVFLHEHLSAVRVASAVFITFGIILIGSTD